MVVWSLLKTLLQIYCLSSLTGKKFRQVADGTDRPARRSASRPSCCRGSLFWLTLYNAYARICWQRQFLLGQIRHIDFRLIGPLNETRFSTKRACAYVPHFLTLSYALELDVHIRQAYVRLAPEICQQQVEIPASQSLTNDRKCGRRWPYVISFAGSDIRHLVTVTYDICIVRRST